MTIWSTILWFYTYKYKDRRVLFKSWVTDSKYPESDSSDIIWLFNIPYYFFEKKEVLKIMSPTTIIFLSEPEVLNVTPKIMWRLSIRLISVFFYHIIHYRSLGITQP